MGFGTHENKYNIEIDGIADCRSSEVTMPSKEHTPAEIYEGNKPSPSLVAGNFKVEDVTVKHAHGLNETEAQMSQWLDDFVSGVDMSRRSARMIVFAEDGREPIAEYEMRRCVPRSFKPEPHNASGTGASMFTFVFRPEDMVKVA
jgi:phage tail-like protein